MFGIAIILGANASQFVFDIIKHFEALNSNMYIRKFIDIGLNSVLCYFYCLTLATLYCNIMAAKHNPHFDKDVVIILESQIIKDQPLTPLLMIENLLQLQSISASAPYGIIKLGEVCPKLRLHKIGKLSRPCSYATIRSNSALNSS